MTVEELNIVITAQNREFNSAINDIIDRLNELGGQVGRTGDDIHSVFADIAKKLAALGLGKVIGDSIMNGGELEQQLGGVEAVFRQHAESMKNAAATAYKDMGLSESAYLAAANKMGALFKGSGFDIAYAADMSQRAMQRASDVASIMGVDVASAMEAVTGAAKGNFTMMDNLGVAINDTTLQMYAQENGLGKLETTQQKVSAAMQMFLDKTEYAAGNYAKENETFSGSLTTMKAELANLSADLGTTLLPTATSLLSMAQGALQVISPMVVELGEGVNSVAQFLLELSPSAKTMLALAVGAAVAIPMATKAQQLYNAANGAWKSLLDVLIPKQLNWNSALKATFGWLAIIAGMLALVASVGAKRREMESDEGKAMEENAEGAQQASDSVDDLAESYEGLGSSADSAKRSLADIDTLNIFSGSASGATAGVDFAAVAEGAQNASEQVAAATDAIADLTSEMDGLNGFDLGGLADTFSTTFGDIGTGFSTIWSAFFGEGDEQYESLKVLNEQIKGLFGEERTRFWNNAGAALYNAFSGEVNETTRPIWSSLRCI